MIEVPYEVVYGQVHDDQWLSPYVKLRFVVPPGNGRLALRFLNPAETGIDNVVTIRLRHRALDTICPIRPGEQAERAWDFSAVTRDTVLDIALRSNTPWTPPPPDPRTLSVKLLGCACRFDPVDLDR